MHVLAIILDKLNAGALDMYSVHDDIARISINQSINF